MTMEDLAWWFTFLGVSIPAIIVIVSWSFVASVILKRSGAGMPWRSGLLAAVVATGVFEFLQPGSPTIDTAANLMINSVMGACAILTVTAVTHWFSRDAPVLLRTVFAAPAGVLALAGGRMIGLVIYFVVWQPHK